MSPASNDWGTAATIAVFVLTYAGVALGRAPGLRIDRAGIALVGASLMIGLGSLSLSEALKAIDLDAITLLLGMMIIVSQLRVSGFFELAAHFALRRAHSAPVLLAAIVIVTGFFSAFLVNDAICLVMAPLVIDVAGALRRNPVPYLLAVAMASNAGSAATFTGNPQNMIIGVASHLPYADFASKLAPAAAVALALTAGLIILVYHQDATVVPESARADIRAARQGDTRDLGGHRQFFCRSSNCRSSAHWRLAASSVACR